MTRRAPRFARSAWAALASPALVVAGALTAFSPTLLPQPAAAAEAAATGQTSASSTEKPRSGRETYTSMIGEVDACNRAQQLRPNGSTVTSMRYWRGSTDGQANVSCRISWSTAADALPTDRPILFGPSSR